MKPALSITYISIANKGEHIEPEVNTTFKLIVF